VSCVFCLDSQAVSSSSHPLLNPPLILFCFRADRDRTQWRTG
jgi:hypothetical protein